FAGTSIIYERNLRNFIVNAGCPVHLLVYPEHWILFRGDMLVALLGVPTLVITQVLVIIGAPLWSVISLLSALLLILGVTAIFMFIRFYVLTKVCETVDLLA